MLYMNAVECLVDVLSDPGYLERTVDPVRVAGKVELPALARELYTLTKKMHGERRRVCHHTLT